MILGFLPSRWPRRTHRRQVHQQRHAGEILQHDARDDERNFLRAGFDRLPVRQRAHVRLADFFAVAIAQHGFEHQADGDGQFGNRPDPAFSSAGSE
jgi:hypothetical protein